MIFDTTVELSQFYKLYGKLMGFEIIKRTSRKYEEGVLKFVSFSCSQNGKSRCKSRHAFKLRPTTKKNCKAKVSVIVIRDGKCKVSSIVYEHNHELNTPNKARFLK